MSFAALRQTISFGGPSQMCAQLNRKPNRIRLGFCRAGKQESCSADRPTRFGLTA
jgi:hypothetical protein